MGESDGSSVVGDDIRDSLGAHGSSFNSAELELGLAGGDLGKPKSTLAVIEESVIGLGLQESDDVHESNGEFVIFSNFSVDGDVTILGEDDQLSFSCGQGEF